MVSYSERVNKIVHFRDLKKKLHFIKNKPDLIPYVTSYYKVNYNAYRKLIKTLIIKLLLIVSLKDLMERYSYKKINKEFVFILFMSPFNG